MSLNLQQNIHQGCFKMIFWWENKIYAYHGLELELTCAVCEKSQLVFHCTRTYYTICDIPFLPFLKRKVIACPHCDNWWPYEVSGVTVDQDDIDSYLPSCKPKIWMFSGAIFVTLSLCALWAIDNGILDKYYVDL